MSTRGWVTVNVFWLIHKDPEAHLLPYYSKDKLQLSPVTSGISSRQERDVVPASVHVSILFKAVFSVYSELPNKRTIKTIFREKIHFLHFLTLHNNFAHVVNCLLKSYVYFKKCDLHI